MTYSKKPEPVLIELSFARRLLDEELLDCRAQRDAANNQFQQAQQAMQIAQTNVIRCTGAETQLLALIEKLKDTKDEKPAPTSDP